MLMSEDSLANYQKKYENQTTSDLSSVTTPITDLENNQQGNHVHVSLSNPLRFNPLQQNRELLENHMESLAINDIFQLFFLARFSPSLLTKHVKARGWFRDSYWVKPKIKADTSI